MDLIDREQTLSAFCDDGEYMGNAIEWAREIVRSVPSVGWIQCSERMPEEEGAYLVTEVSYGELYVSKGYYVQENGERIWRNDTYEYDIIDPIAWMELPEPYREDKE